MDRNDDSEGNNDDDNNYYDDDYGDEGDEYYMDPWVFFFIFIWPWISFLPSRRKGRVEWTGP